MTVTRPARLKFPTALTVLVAVLITVWLGRVPDSGRRLRHRPGDGRADPRYLPRAPGLLPMRRPEQICSTTSLENRFVTLWDATPNGLYGVENAQGFVGGDESGVLYGSAQIFLFVLAIGAFITVTMKTGAIQTGIGRLALRFRRSPPCSSSC